MKSFRQIVSEVAEPKAGDEKTFKAKHIVTKVDYPVDVDDQFTGGKTSKKAPKRKADHEAGEDTAVYEAADTQMGTVTVTTDAQRKARAQAYRDKKEGPAKIKLRGFGPDHKKSNMSNPVARGALMNKEALDPVDPKELKGKHKDRRDKDIDNDGDVDDSDRYLHARRKAISKAIKQEEAELEESITKMSHGRLKFHMNNKSVPHGSYSWDQMKAERDRRLKTGEGEAYKKAKASMSEDFDQLDEIGDTAAGKKKLKNLIVNRTQKAVDAGASLERRPEKAAEYDRAQKRHMKTIGRAATRLAKEEVEQIDEISKKTLGNYIRKASDDRAQNALEVGKTGKINFKGLKRRQGINRATAKLTKEEVEQLDELSPNTLHSYIKGASKDLAKRSRMSGYDDKRGNYADGDKNRKRANKRMQGITSASGRLADKANMAENAWEEIPMMQRQLQFISYAAEEISDYLDMGVDPEEWFQNKLAGLHKTMLSMYAYAQGEMQMSGGMYGEEVELDEAAPTKKAITRALQGMKVQPKDKVSVKKAPWEKNEDLDEVTLSAIKKPVTTTGPDGKTRTVYKTVKSISRDEHGQEKISTNESAEILDEAFKAGMVKLKNGGSVVLKKEDADLLNKMFKDLSSTNRKKMQEVAMKDKNGFEEILGFAREAL